MKRDGGLDFALNSTKLPFPAYDVYLVTNFPVFVHASNNRHTPFTSLQTSFAQLYSFKAKYYTYYYESIHLNSIVFFSYLLLDSLCP